MKYVKRFRTRVLIYFMLVILLPMLMLAFWSYSGTVTSASQNIYRRLAQKNLEWLGGFEARRHKVEQSAYSISNNPSIRSFLTQKGYKDVEVIRETQRMFRPMMSWLYSTNDEIYRAHFFTANPEVPEGWQISHFSRYEGEAWFEDMLAEAGQGRWLAVQRAPDFEYSKGRDMLVASYQIRLIGRPAAFLQLDVNASWLYQGISMVKDTQSGQVLLSEIYPEIIGTCLQLTEDQDGFENSGYLRINGEKLLCSIYTAEDMGLTMVCAVPESEVYPELTQARFNFTVQLCALFISSFVLIWLLVRRVTGRIEVIGSMVNRIARGEYRIEYPARYDDEIDRLGADVVAMGGKMDHLVNQVLMQKILTRDAEFNALQAQINPHFIFNTLESFRMVVELQGLTGLSDDIGKLGKLMRYSLAHSPVTSLEAEIENVVSYVDIQNISKNGRIRLQIECDDALRSKEVLRLMLQPIAENAIIHGMRPRENLSIRMEIRTQDGWMRVSVSNDGKQMTGSEERRLRSLLEEARAMPAPLDGHGIALQGIQRRLILQYGEQCTIHVEQNIECGFLVWFLIPLK